MVNDDHRTFKLAEMEKVGSINDTWQGVNTHRKDFVPTFNQHLDIRGNRDGFGKRAEATADYLGEKQWGDPTETEAKGSPPEGHSGQAKHRAMSYRSSGIKQGHK